MSICIRIVCYNNNKSLYFFDYTLPPPTVLLYSKEEDIPFSIICKFDVRSDRGNECLTFVLAKANSPVTGKKFHPTAVKFSHCTFQAAIIVASATAVT